METRVSATILLFLIVGYFGLTAVAPRPVIPHQRNADLTQAEARFASDPRDPQNAARLAGLYLDLKRPQLAIALIRSVDPAQLEDPTLSHQLARAYEASQQIPDAFATATLALARCARAIGSSDAFNTPRVPTHRCSERALASLERHRSALAHMSHWGVQNTRDPRIALAYRIAERRVSLASYSTP